MIKTFNILENGVVVNTIYATEEFVAANYTEYEEYIEPQVETHTPSKEELARQWRDQELERTDSFALLPDFPNLQILLEYRQDLRNWPSSIDFPDKQPIVFEQRITSIT